MTWYRHRYFFHLYGFFPHRAINRLAGRLSRIQNPPWIIQGLIKKWNSRIESQLTLSELKFKTIEAFFLRDYKAGQRPFAPGFMSPVDGILMAQGKLGSGTLIQAKGQDYSLRKLLTDSFFQPEYGIFSKGIYYTLFLTPDGYHGIHMPEAGILLACQWVPGRYFPQNAEAVKYIPKIYEKNERLVLKIRNSQDRVFFLVMVGASLIGGIFLRDVPRVDFQKLTELKVNKTYQKGERLGHFTFGSTVILILPEMAQVGEDLPNGAKVKMGEALM